MAIFVATLCLAGDRSPRLSVTGDVSRGHEYSVDELRRNFSSEIKEVSFIEKGRAATAHAFPLASLVAAARPRLDPLRKHAEYSFAVVVIGADGYSAAFSGAELSTELNRGTIWVALDWNGAPLSPADAPIRLIVACDPKPSRWVHAVTNLRIVNLAPRGHGPAPEKHS